MSVVTPNFLVRLVLVGAVGLVAPMATTTLHGETTDPAAIEHFETKVRPLLLARCVKCHGPQKSKARPCSKKGSRRCPPTAS
jgi:hypothetical protein